MIGGQGSSGAGGTWNGAHPATGQDAGAPGYRWSGGSHPPLKQRRTGLVFVLLAVAVVLVLLLGVAGVFAIRMMGADSGGPESSEQAGAPAIEGDGSGTPAAAALDLGDCILEPTGAEPFTTVACSEPHYAQLYAQEPVAGETYPGREALDEQAVPFCERAVGENLDTGALSEDVAFAYQVPDEELWADEEERYVNCFAQSTDGSDMTGSLLPQS
ncbi:hypothetical protein [Brevibacterium litoralis]|uniref:hypothetical protein n=1 Tax=Brevibacterium litoralis TaxID=3138935 RepID=UPI0032EE54C7